MQNNFAIRSWMLFVIALLAWCGAAYFIYMLLQMQFERQSYEADAAQANLQAGQSAQLRALARETADDRAALDKIANVDVVSAVNLIESVSASGTPVRVVSAQAVKAAGKSQQMNVVDLTARAEGSFSSIVHIMQILESIPLATSIQEIDLSHNPGDQTGKNPSIWQLSVRLRFYTTATLST